MPPKIDELPSELIFNPHWFADPPPWWIYQVFEEGQRTAVASIQLQLVKDTLTAQLKAVEGLQGAMNQQR